MNKQDAEKITTEYLKPVYGFALKRCRNLQDAEDLSQDIILKIFTAMLKREDIVDVQKYVWTVAHNCLANYYRDNGRSAEILSPEELSGQITDNTDIENGFIFKTEIIKLRAEIAYLSKVQREIVIAYYFKNKKQNQIAKEMDIPVGTVKWHLFEAKKELKRGMDIMRENSELKFNPVKFSEIGTNGIIGDNGTNKNYFKTYLPQNIVYSVWKSAKTVNEIADELGVSPVYVESEVELLEYYGFLTKQGERYLCNILLDEPSDEIVALQNEMYEKISGIFANELFDELQKTDILGDCGILGGFTGDVSLSKMSDRDRNFVLWALIPFITASSGEADTSVSFDEVASYRADGGYNICFATVENAASKKIRNIDSINIAYGPYYRESDTFNYFQFDSEWSGKRIDSEFLYKERDYIRLLENIVNDIEISPDAATLLAQAGLIKICGTPDGLHKIALRCLLINDPETEEKYVSIGDRIKEKHEAEFSKYIKCYSDAVLSETPEHLRKLREYELQFTVFGDKRFITNCLCELVRNGKLQPPTEEQKSALSTIIIRK